MLRKHHTSEENHDRFHSSAEKGTQSRRDQFDTFDILM